ncbi:helix-turn-helix domain-containing protein [Anaerobacillus sp. MEB173]|uniref:helix-turn-helix domain-containing protein n=1 Tax=Anaerobacillus sp. MEB173 TaxID=3383345 RepID=UPI003F926A43
MLGSRIRDLRSKKGLTMTELANRAQVAKSYLSSVERNLQTNPSIQFLDKISKELNVDVPFLLDTDKEDVDKQLDNEWIQLAKEAQESGISKEQFKEFLEFSKWQKLRRS